jgi:ribosomal protein S18 acetylase RimI-like enzyme
MVPRGLRVGHRQAGGAVTVRLAGPADLEALLPLVDDFHLHERLATTPEGRRAALARLLREPQRGCVALWDGPAGPVAYGILAYGYSLEFGGIDAFVDELFVAPAHRGHGLGGRLLDALEAEARRASAVAVHLEVDDGNGRAQGLYARRGYALHPRLLMTLRLG